MQLKQVLLWLAGPTTATARKNALVASTAITLSVAIACTSSLARGRDRSPSPERSGGGKIAFTRVQEDVRRPGSDYRFEAEIWVMNEDGTHPKRLTHNTSDDFGAAWSPDGKRIAFGATQFGPDGRGGLVMTGQSIFLVDIEGTAQVRLTDSAMRAQFPSWSSDGKTIVFHGSRSGGPGPPELFLIDPNGTTLRQLTENTWSDARPDWSPDDRRIAFQSDREGSVEIHVMNADGSDPRQLTRDPPGVINQAPDWSPDGKRILFQSNRDGNVEIYVMDADGGNQTRLTHHPGRDLDAEWSADGTRIAFDRDIPPVDEEIRQLFIMRADGSDPTQLTGLPSKNGHAAWHRGRIP